MYNSAISPMVKEALTALYRFNDETFPIRLYLSVCKNQYCFFNPALGEVRINKECETIHSFTLPVSNHYKQFLLTVVQQWKHQFPYYQTNEQEITLEK